MILSLWVKQLDLFEKYSVDELLLSMFKELDRSKEVIKYKILIPERTFLCKIVSHQLGTTWLNFLKNEREL